MPETTEDLMHEIWKENKKMLNETADLDEAIEELEEKLEVLREGRVGIAKPFQDRIDELTAKVTDSVIGAGESFECGYGMAKMKKGYTQSRWDSKKLTVMAEQHPTLLECKKETVVQPKVTLELYEEVEGW